MVWWHQWLNGHEFAETLGDSEGQGSQAWHAAVHGVTKSRTWLSDWTELKYYFVSAHYLKKKNHKAHRSAEALVSASTIPMSLTLIWVCYSLKTYTFSYFNVERVIWLKKKVVLLQCAPISKHHSNFSFVDFWSQKEHIWFVWCWGQVT